MYWLEQFVIHDLLLLRYPQNVSVSGCAIDIVYRGTRGGTVSSMHRDAVFRARGLLNDRIQQLKNQVNFAFCELQNYQTVISKLLAPVFPTAIFQSLGSNSYAFSTGYYMASIIVGGPLILMMTPISPRFLNLINDFVLLRFRARTPEDLSAIEVIYLLLLYYLPLSWSWLEKTTLTSVVFLHNKYY